MSRKLEALGGPMKSWVRPKGWRATWFMEGHVHPEYIAVKLTDRGAAVQECARLMRVHGEELGAWYTLPAEKIPNLRPVWVAGFRRLPTRGELEQGIILAPRDF